MEHNSVKCCCVSFFYNNNIFFYIYLESRKCPKIRTFCNINAEENRQSHGMIQTKVRKKTDKVAEYCRHENIGKKEKNRQNCGVIQTKIRKMIDMVRKKTDIYEGNNTDTEENRHKIRKYSG